MYVRAKISEGKNIAEPLAETKVFPPMVVQMIGVGEATGAMDAMLNKIADFYDDEVDVAVAALTAHDRAAHDGLPRRRGRRLHRSRCTCRSSASPATSSSAMRGAALAGVPDRGRGRAGRALHRKLVWLTLFRLVTVTVLLGGTAVVTGSSAPQAAEAVAPLYAVVAATYGASLAFAVLAAACRRCSSAPSPFAQIVARRRHRRGGGRSPGSRESVFVFMFVLAIVNGAILLYRAGAVGGGGPRARRLRTASCLWLHRDAGGSSARRSSPTAPPSSPPAALAGYLAEQLRRTGERLAESEGDLAAITALHESIVQSVTSGLLTLDRARPDHLPEPGRRADHRALPRAQCAADARRALVPGLLPERRARRGRSSSTPAGAAAARSGTRVFALRGRAAARDRAPPSSSRT